MSRPPSARPPNIPTPAPSSPPPSESFLSDVDGTAPSLLDGGDYAWEQNSVDSKALNLVSWKLDVNARAEDGVDKRGFNAISTVLNHPTKKANPLRASRKPLPPLQAPPSIPRPPPASHYDPYLQSITPLYDSFISAQAAAAGKSDLIGLDEPHATARSDLPPLESVPDAFFDPAFDLSNPITWSSIIDSPGAGPSSSSNDDRQDALSSHLDTLERHLIHEIGLRSSSFFSALSNLQDLHSESASCLDRITGLQSSLEDIGSKQAQKGLEVIEAQDRLKVLRVTERNVKTVAELEEIIRVANGLVEAGDWAGGLGCLSDIGKWWERFSQDPQVDQNADHLPLATLPALLHLPDTVSSLIEAISSQLESALNSLLLSVLAKTDEGAEFDEERFRGSVEPLLAGICSCGKAERLEDIWREILTTSIREGSRKHLPVSPAEDIGDEEGRPPEARGASLADSLKGMDHSTYLLLSTQMFKTMLSRLQIAQRIGETLQALLDTHKDTPTLALQSPTDDTAPHVTSGNKLDLADVLASACELANNRASKILGVRAEQHGSLPLEEFVELFKENWDFVVATETLAKRMIVSLRGVTASQARAFLVSYHSTRLTKSANLIQEEQWSQIDVSSSVQHAVNLLIEAAVSDPAECQVPMQQPATNGQANGGTGKVLTVEDKTFFVVKATAESLVLLGDYLKIVINLELVVTDVMSRIIEFLKSFNSITCQVVLGAGAMRSAGLKNITAKHLALASQSLSVMVALIPYIREFIRRHLNPKQAVMLTEFDKLKRDYQEHQNEIHAKLVAIMSDRLAVHVGSLREIDWEATPEKDGPRQYAEMLVKETATLHKVLSKYLAASTVEGVLSEVLAAIVHRLSEEYGKIELKSDDGKKRMSQDVALINTKLAPLSESGTSVASLTRLVKDKPTPRRAIGQAMRGMLNRVNSGSGPKPEGNEVEVNEDEAARASADDEENLAVVEEPTSITDQEVIESQTKQEAADQPTAPAEEDPAPDGPEVDQESPDKEHTDAATDTPTQEEETTVKRGQPGEGEDVPAVPEKEVASNAQESEELGAPAVPAKGEAA